MNSYGKSNYEGGKMKRCSHCGKEIHGDAVYCPNCGAVQREESGKKEQRSNVARNNVQGEKQSSMLLKIVGCILGVLYAYRALQQFSYLLAFRFWLPSDFLCEPLLVLTSGWSATILFLIAFKCRKKYGLQLLYVLVGCAVFRCFSYFLDVFKIYFIYGTWRGYGSVFIAKHILFQIAAAILIVLACYLIMKKEDMLYIPKNQNVKASIQKIPEVLNILFSEVERDVNHLIKNTGNRQHSAAVPSGNASNQDRNTKSNSGVIAEPRKPGSEVKRLVQVVKSPVFLIFGILYTINLVYEIFSGFSILKLVTSLFSILICMAIWMIYSSGTNGRLDGSGLAIVNGIMIFRSVMWVIGGVLLMLLAVLATVIAANIADTATVVSVLVFAMILLGVFLNFAYWYSLHKTFGGMKAVASGQDGVVTAGIYPMFVLVLAVIKNIGMFILTVAVGVALPSFLYGYVQSFGMSLGELTNELGLGYSVGSGLTDSVLQSILGPAMQILHRSLWSYLIILVQIAISVLEIVLLAKIRSSAYMERNE